MLEEMEHSATDERFIHCIIQNKYKEFPLKDLAIISRGETQSQLKNEC